MVVALRSAVIEPAEGLEAPRELTTVELWAWYAAPPLSWMLSAVRGGFVRHRQGSRCTPRPGPVRNSRPKCSAMTAFDKVDSAVRCLVLNVGALASLDAIDELANNS